MDHLAQTKARWRFHLPHWEVAGQPHFVTVRCAGSLPATALIRVREIHDTLSRIDAQSPGFVALQRKYFLLCERYLDLGHGFCPFRESPVCDMVMGTFANLPAKSGWRVCHATLMPNHAHLLIEPGTAAFSLKAVVRGWKWFVAKEANRILERSGSFWQSDWFDRWARTEAETRKMRDYIRANPVKARLTTRWQDYRWTVSNASGA